MTQASQATRQALLEAARGQLLSEGYAGMSTRKVADAAGAPLSQVHYHFGSKQGLILSLLEEENRRRFERQTQMYDQPTPLWQRYEQACDFLEDDLDSGYVRVLQEMIAGGWTNPEIAASTRRLLEGWFDLLAGLAQEAERRHGRLGPFTPEEVSTLIGCAFMGAEAMLLLGFDRRRLPIRSSLRRLSAVIRAVEERPAALEAHAG